MTEEESAVQRQLLVELTTQGNCRGVIIEDLKHRDTLLAVRAAVNQTCVDNKSQSRAHFAVVSLTPMDCRLEEIVARVEQALQTLQIQNLDMLLLQALSLPGTNGLHARKHAVLEAWEHMLTIQQAGLVQHIGVSDLTVQDVEFLLKAYPSNTPKAWCITIQLPGVTFSPSGHDVPLEDVITFAHGHGIDVLGRFPFHHLENLEPQHLREDWEGLTRNLAERFRDRPFKFLVVHENEGTAASHHINAHALGDTKVMQAPMQIVVRYLLQKGLIVIPRGSNDSHNDENSHEAALREIFGPLAHPFTMLHPSCSPHKLHSSLLTRDDLASIDCVLPLTTSFPLPRTPMNTTGTS